MAASMKIESLGGRGIVALDKYLRDFAPTSGVERTLVEGSCVFAQGDDKTYTVVIGDPTRLNVELATISIYHHGFRIVDTQVAER